MDYEMEKLILETKKDLQIVEILSDLDDRITKIENNQIRRRNNGTLS